MKINAMHIDMAAAYFTERSHVATNVQMVNLAAYFALNNFKHFKHVSSALHEDGADLPDNAAKTTDKVGSIGKVGSIDTSTNAAMQKPYTSLEEVFAAALASEEFAQMRRSGEAVELARRGGKDGPLIKVFGRPGAKLPEELSELLDHIFSGVRAAELNEQPKVDPQTVGKSAAQL